MSLFHKKLSDMKKLVAQGKYTEAKVILEEHLKSEHSFESDLVYLKGAISAYQHQLINLRNWWGLTESAPKTTKGSLPTFYAMVEEAEKHLASAEFVIRRLRKDAKLKLE